MDPRHRDRVAFVQVCGGRFEKDMTVRHARTGKAIGYRVLRSCLVKTGPLWKMLPR